MAKKAADDDAIPLHEKLQHPFPEGWIKFLPQTVSKDGNTAKPACFVDARHVAKRLTNVLGLGGWSEDSTVVSITPDSVCVKCEIWIEIEINGKMGSVSRTDFGNARIDSVFDASAAIKNAATDAFKRAAVKFGVGAYLYFVKLDWMPYDNFKKKFKEIPKMPEWALPTLPIDGDLELGAGEDGEGHDSEPVSQSRGDAWEPPQGQTNGRASQPPQQKQRPSILQWADFKPALIKRCKLISEEVGRQQMEMFGECMTTMRSTGWREPQEVTRKQLDALNSYFDEQKAAAVNNENDPWASSESM